MSSPRSLARSAQRILLFGLLPLLAWLPTPTSSQEPDSPEPPEDAPIVEEVLVVSASRSEQQLHEVPATMTVLSSEQIEALPADDFGDILRNVPGLNVIQFGARDIQIAGRSASSALATSELVLVDNRTVYLDFLGFVIWEFLPSNPDEIEQIEVVRGPASSVWGANALNGVINVITKSPREMVGTTFTIGAGELGTALANVLHAGATERVGYKVSAGYYQQDPYERPSGLVPGTQTPYPDFDNSGTEQPKVDLRLDYDLDDRSGLSFSGGWAATNGIVNSGLGPFDIQRDSSLSYAKVSYQRGTLLANLFANVLDGEALNQLSVGADGLPLSLGFDSESYTFDLSQALVVGDHNLLSWGLTARNNDFELTIAPTADERDEYGVFLQDELLLGRKVRWVLGARYDDLDPIGEVFSPRTTLIVEPIQNQTLRLPYNRAFRAPSLIETDLRVTILNTVSFPFGDYQLPTTALGNPAIEEQELEAYELGYVGTFGRRTSVSVAIYRNELSRSVDFYPATFYTGSNPPPGWPLPDQVLDVPPFAGALPETFSFRNIGKLVNEGVEAAVSSQVTPRWSWFANYSFQDTPEVQGFESTPINIPPEHRVNAGLAFSGSRFFASGNVNHVADAFWTDVLDERYFGPTDDYTMTNVTVGVRFAQERVGLSLSAQNLFDERIQQHVFGDIISRKISGQLKLRF